MSSKFTRTSENRVHAVFLSLLVLLVSTSCALPAAIFLQNGGNSHKGFGVDGITNEKQHPQLTEIIDTYNRGDHTQAAMRARRLAKEGLADAQFMLGMMYEQGEGVPQGMAEAVRWYKQSAQQGNVAAKLNLGLISFRKVYNGENSGNISEAIKWLESADGDGDAKSAFYLGEIHRQGLGRGKDAAKAFTYFKRAADRGLPMGCNMVGIAFAEGKGTAKTPKKAFAYFLKSANRGLADGIYNVALSYQKGLGVEKDNPLASTWYLRAARGGYLPAFVKIGRRYVQGDGIMKDETAGAAWLHRASVTGEPTAQFLLAQLYLNGVGVEKNLRSALNHFAHSSNSGNMEARYALAQMLAGGLGTEDGKPNHGEAHGLAKSAGELLNKSKEFALQLEKNLSDESKQASRELLKKLKESDRKRSESIKPASSKKHHRQ